MKPTLRLTISLLTLALASGCASPAGTPGTTGAVPTQPAQSATQLAPAAPIAAPDIPVFFARPRGNHGPALAYGLESGYPLFTLPDGLFSADGRGYFAAGSGGGGTALDSYSPRGGRLLASTRLEGEWTLAFVNGRGYQVALSRQSADHTRTEIQIRDDATLQMLDRAELAGNFEIDGLSPDGQALFLIEYLPAAAPDHYQVRLYTLGDHVLQPGALVDKRFPDEVMAGERWDTVSTPDGLWLLTLYLRTQKNVAFIHALNTMDRFTFCIDLPSAGGSLADQKYDSLAVRPGGETIYVANAVTGMVTEVSLSSLDVEHITTFKAGIQLRTDPTSPAARSLLSADGARLYFSHGPSVWVYDTAARSVRGPFTAAGPVAGLGLSVDGARLLAAGQDGSLSVFDALTGAETALH
jgi:hypothetical protein